MNRIIRNPFRQMSFRRTWDQFRVSFWFAPLVMSIIAILLSRIFYSLDALIPNEIFENSRIILSGSTNELRPIIANLATTTLATAGVVFSLLTLPLSMVASQYGSRLLRIYRRDRTTQFVLGMFTGTFFYCLNTVLLLPKPGEVYDLPQLTVSFALVFFIATFASLIALIHHFSTALQAPNIVAAASSELKSAVLEFSSDWAGEDLGHASGNSIPLAGMNDTQGYKIKAKHTGYIQSIDLGHILALAESAGVVIHLVRKPGQFVNTGDQIAVIWPADRVDLQLSKKLSQSFLMGNQRTPTQDIEYAVDQIAEVAIRAMSPAINDPFTAMNCIDHFSAGLVLFIEKEPPQPAIYDSNGQLRMVYEPIDFNELLNAAFDMLRHASCDNAFVLLRMLDAFEEIGQKTQNVEQRQELVRQVKMVQAESNVGNLISVDREAIRQRSEALVQSLEG